MVRHLLFIPIIVACAISISLAQRRSIPERNEMPDDPGARAAYDQARLCDPATGLIPENAALNEWEFAQTLPKKNPHSSKAGYPLSTFDWVPIGPYNQSGRVQAVALDIKNESNMLAGTASGGVWRSVDGGTSWVKTTLPNQEQTVSAIVQDTRSGKESTWYYSTSEELSTTGRRETENIRTHSYGNGIYKSTDNGATWTVIASTQSRSGFSAPKEFQGIWNLALDERNLSQDIIYAACSGGIMRSSDDGATWTKVLGDDSVTCFNSEIIIGSGGTFYAAIGSAYNGTRTPHQGIWRSTDGINWTNITPSSLPNTIRRTRLALSASTDTVLYSLTETPTNWATPDTSFQSIHSLLQYTYHSGDGSGTKGTWQTRYCPFSGDYNDGNASLSGYALTLAVHPDDVNQILVGGQSLFYSASGCANNIDTVRLGGYTPTYIGALHPDMHCIIFSRTNHSQVYVGNDGGVYEIDDVSTGDGNWNDLDNGINSGQVYYSSLDHDSPGSPMIVSGLQDNNSMINLSTVPTDPWGTLTGGDGMTTAITGAGEFIYTCSEYGFIYLLNFDGVSFTFYEQLLPPADTIAGFYTNYIIEPNLENILFQANSDELWRLDNLSDLEQDAGTAVPDWTEITDVHNILRPMNAYISAFAYSHVTQDRLFFGTSNSRIFELDNSASTKPKLKELTSPAFPKNAFISGIDIDQMDEQQMVVVFSNYNIQSVFRTTDGGTTWAAVSGNLEQNIDGSGNGPSVRCIKIYPLTADSAIYYLGTSVGLFSTTSLAGSNTIWSQEGPESIGNLIVENIDARFSDGSMIASTQGGGVYMNAALSGVVASSALTSQPFIVSQNFPNPFHDRSTVQFMLNVSAQVQVELFNTLGEKLGVICNQYFASGTHTLDLSAGGIMPAHLASGNYFLRFSSGSSAKTIMISMD